MHPISLLKSKILSIVILLAMGFAGFAQAPNLLNYQGVARNAVGNPLPNQSMILRLSVRNLSATGTVVYSETRPITTNLGGLFSVQIGSVGSTSSMGTIAGVNWLVGDKYLQVEIDPAANNNYINLGTVQLVSVPYAFATGNAATVATNANLSGVVTSVGNQTSIANGAITNEMIASVNKSKVGLDLVNNTSDASKPISTLAQAALDLKANTTELTNLANAIGTKLNIADSTTQYVTPTQLGSYRFSSGGATIDTTSLSNRINLKASAADLAILTTNIASNTASITANTAEINLKAPIASPSFTGTVTTGEINTGVLSATSITTPVYASTPQALTAGATINWNPALGLNASVTLDQNSTLSFTNTPNVGSYGTVVLTQDGTGSRTIALPTISGVANTILGSTSTSTVALSTAGNSKDILNFYYDGINCYWNIGQGYGTAATASSSTANLASGVTGILAVANGGTGAATLTGYVKGAGTSVLTASASIPVADVTGAAPLVSPTFTGTVTTEIINSGAVSATSVNTGTITATSINAPIYASTPQALTDAGTIAWNPALGLNASVTLAGNRTLSFTTTPTPGAYGTLVVSQDAIGSRTITLPTTANKVLGSTSTTSIALSSAANAKDILNFYYDGTNCFWNIGQGYGTAASSSSASISLTTTGTGAATLSGTTLNIPSNGLPASGNTAGEMLYWNGSAWVKVAAGTNGQTLSFMSGKPMWTGSLPANTVVSNGRIWMDRNLGASQVAISLTDVSSFGDLYQWGRGTDGHEKRTSSTTSTLSNLDLPGNATFITTSNSDWRSSKNDNLWQGVNGINNPCPSGYRVPTEAEWRSEYSSWSSPNSEGAFASPLKLPKAGYRGDDGSIRPTTSGGLYWSSTVSDGGYIGRAKPLVHDSPSYLTMGDNARSYGFSVRCIKD